MASKIDYAPVLNVPLATSLFTIDTRDGVRTSEGFVVDPQSPYSINIQKNQQLFSGAVQRIALTEIVLPWNIPNVNPTNNALFLEKDDGTLYTVEISPGFYDPSGPNGLAESIQADLVANSVFGTATWSVIFSDEAQFIISTISSGVQFRILPSLGISKGVASNFNNFPSAGPRSSTLATMMGFDYTGTEYSATVAGSYASMTYTRYVDITSSILCKNQKVRDTSTNYFTGNNLLTRLYIGAMDNKPIIQYVGEDKIFNIAGISPFLLREKFSVPKDINWNPEEFLASCNIELKDEFGNKLYSPTENPLWNGPANPPALPSANVRMNCGNSGFVQLSFLISEAGEMKGNYSIFK